MSDLLADKKSLQERGDRIHKSFHNKMIGYYDLLQQGNVLEEYAAVLRPLLERKR